jgi:hypothetical protein
VSLFAGHRRHRGLIAQWPIGKLRTSSTAAVMIWY